MNSLSQKSQMFTAYNKMKATAADPKRLNRALGVAQSKQERPYVTTAESCDCPDFVYRNNICKHILSYRMTNPAVVEAVAPAPRRSLAQINEDLFG